MAAKSLRNPKRRPTHPGAILREDVLPALKMTQKEFADWIGVSRLTVSEIFNENRTITPDMAMRLGKALGNGSEIWLRMQQASLRKLKAKTAKARGLSERASDLRKSGALADRVVARELSKAARDEAAAVMSEIEALSPEMKLAADLMRAKQKKQRPKS